MQARLVVDPISKRQLEIARPVQSVLSPTASDGPSLFLRRKSLRELGKQAAVVIAAATLHLFANVCQCLGPASIMLSAAIMV